MKIFGAYIVRGMAITMGHFINSYWIGLKRRLGFSSNGKRGPGAKGIFTVQYPEERLPIPERFRVLPVLLYEEETGEPRCTACGICAQVCPPQCIWIVQAKDENGKPKNKPEEFTIETNVCMNCGLCAEFCPFDSIKMDTRFEIADYSRKPGEVHKLQDLLVSTEHYARSHPQAWAAEQEKRAKKAAAKAAPPKPPAA